MELSGITEEINLLNQLEEKYGTPIYPSRNAQSITGLNPLFLAHYFSFKLQLKFCLKKHSFTQYDNHRGVWDYLSDNNMSELLWTETYSTLKHIGNAEPHVFSRHIKPSIISTIQNLLKSILEYNDSESVTVKRYFHAANCMMVFDMKAGTWSQEAFAPEFHSHYRSEIVYDAQKTCPRFLTELVQPAMTEDDIEILQLYLGQCLLTSNLSQTFLLLEGTPGGGKSTLVNIIEKMIGREHCSELRAAHTTGRFEIASLSGKKLLTGKDVSSQFMNNSGGRSLKFLTGKDTVTGEYKNSNKRVSVEGNFNIIITSNNTLRMKFDGDLEAWRRRILIIKYQSAPPKEKITDFDDLLIEEEGSGILNWIMEGAKKLIQNGSTIPKNASQKLAVDNLLKSSDPLVYFVDSCIHPTPQSNITTAEVIEVFTIVCHNKKWDIPTDREIQKRLKSYMAEKHRASISHSVKRGGKSKRGYYNFQIRHPDQK